MKKDEGMRKNKYLYNIQTDNSVVIARGKRGDGWVEVGKVGSEEGWRQKKTAQANGHTMQCANDVLLSWTLETVIVLQTNVIPKIQLIKIFLKRTSITVKTGK